jgi:beta-lactamase superfamily II metal-dependent hydrolase
MTAAPAPADIVFEALPAGYGDALLLTCDVDGAPWRLLVDTGPDECWPMLRERLSAIPANADGRRRIDLAVITHIDHDHIGGAKLLFDDRTLGLEFGDIWFNAPSLKQASRGVAEGVALAGLLGAADRALPWNEAWGGGLAVTTAQQPFVELPTPPGAPKLTLLSPTPATLDKLFAVWARELAALDKPARPKKVDAVSRGLDLPAVEKLAAAKTPLDHAPANGSSIALLVEHRGASLLLGADAHAPVLVDALTALAAHRGRALPWDVDVFKISHHASRGNVTTALLQALRAKHYVVSTNGAIFDHPDDEAIARVVRSGPRGHTLWFNHANAHSSRWAGTPLEAWQCRVVEPTGAGGVRLEARGGAWAAAGG